MSAAPRQVGGAPSVGSRDWWGAFGIFALALSSGFVVGLGLAAWLALRPAC